jgi:hypothetical protein
MMQLIFFAAAMLTLFIGHVGFWYVLIRFFHVTSAYNQAMIAIVIFGLVLNALIASYIIHKWDNLLTRIYYIFSNLWVGLSINLCLMAVLIGGIKLAGWTFLFSVPDIYLKVIFLAGAVIISAIGVYRAFYPRLTSYDVYIKDLPAAWDNKVVVQLSDIHLGPIYRKKFFDYIINRTNELKPEAVFITGDLFDGTESDFAWLNHPFTRLQAPKGIYYGFGNHDLYLGFSRVVGLLKDNPLKILDNQMVVVDGLQIIGINYSFNSDFNLEEAILKQVGYDYRQSSILLLHVPKNTELAKKVGIDLQLSGHTHDGQLWPFNYAVNLAHGGHGYGFFQEGDFSLIVNSGAGSWGPPMRTSARSEIVKITLHRKADPK